MDYENDNSSGREIPVLQFGARRAGGWLDGLDGTRNERKEK